MNKKRWISWIMAMLLFAGVAVSPVSSYHAAAGSEIHTAGVPQKEISEETAGSGGENEKAEARETKNPAKETDAETSPEKQNTAEKSNAPEKQKAPEEQKTTEKRKTSAELKTTKENKKTEQETEAQKEETVQLQIKNKDEAFIPGREGRLEAEILLAEGELSFQWQVSDDGENWSDIGGAKERIYRFAVSDEVFSKWYRICADDGKQTYVSEGVRIKKAVCYTVSQGMSRASSTKNVNGHESLEEAFAEGHSESGDHNVTIILLQDVEVEDTIKVGTPKASSYSTNTYTLKSEAGKTYRISPKNGFKAMMFYMDGDSDAIISGESKVILENVSIQGYPKEQEPVGINQNDALFYLLNKREPTGNKDDGNTWIEIREGVTLDNPNEPIIQLRHEIQSNAVTIDAASGKPITLKGEIEVPAARCMVNVKGKTANLTQDSDVAFALDYYALKDGWGAVENRWLVKYTGGKKDDIDVLPTEVAYFRLKDPEDYWIVAKEQESGESSLEIHKNRPDNVYLGAVLSDGKTEQTDAYAEGVLPGIANGDSSRSAVSALSVAYAKIRQLNLDPDEEKSADLVIVSEVDMGSGALKEYRLSGTGFSGEGYDWKWKQKADICRYCRPAGKTAADAGYADEKYGGILFRIGNGVSCTAENVTIDGNPETSIKDASAQAPAIHVSDGGKVLLKNASLVNHANMAKEAKGGAVFLEQGAALAAENVTITGNKVSDGGHGAAVFQSNGAEFSVKGSYTTEPEQQVWLSDSASLTVTGALSVNGNAGIPVDFTTYEKGRVLAVYEEKLPLPDRNETEKFSLDENKLLSSGLYVESEDRKILLDEKTGGMNFGFTKKTEGGTIIPEAVFRIYTCSETNTGGHTHSRLADLYGTEADNCWRQLSQQRTGEEGSLTFGFLKDGEYRLAEYRAPYGYAAAKGQWKLTISSAAEKKITMEYLSKDGEEEPKTKIQLNEQGNGTDVSKSYITNKQAEMPDFSFVVKPSDQEKPSAGVVFELYSCEHWEDPNHTHQELADEQGLLEGGCWAQYKRGANGKGQFVSNGKGVVSCGKLMDGDYMLKQITAVDGYELPAGQWLIRVRHDAENPITIIGKGEHNGDSFQIRYDPDTGKFTYTLINRLLVEPGHEKYVKYNKEEKTYTLTLDVTGNERAFQTSENPVSVVLIVDTIGGVHPTQNFERVKKAANAIIEKVLAVDSENEVAVVDMNGSFNTHTDGFYDDAWVQETDSGKNWTSNKEDALSAVASLERKIDESHELEETSYGVNWQAGFMTAQELFNVKKGPAKEKNDRVIVFLAGGTEINYYDDRGVTTDQYNVVSPYKEFTLKEAGKLMEAAGKDKTKLEVVSVCKYSDTGSNLSGIKGHPPRLYEDMKKNYQVGEKLWKLYRDYNDEEDEDVLKELVNSFAFYEPKNYLQTNVTVQDTLSKYAELVSDTWEGSYTLEAVKADGSKGTIPDGTKALWDAETKTVTLKFPEEFELENGTTYRISFEIKPTSTAYEEYINQGLSYGKTVGDWGTDAPDNATSSGKPGFFCNTEAKVTYDFANQKGAVCEYRRPVIQVLSTREKQDGFFMKVDDADVEETDGEETIDLPLSGAEFNIYVCPNQDKDHKHEELASEESGKKGCWVPIKENGENKIYRSGEDGIVKWSLPPDEYMLVETKAPSGYRLPKGQLLLRLEHPQYEKYMEFEAKGEDAPRFFYESTIYIGIATPKVTNKKGAMEPLPETGGEGMEGLYRSGIFLLAISGAAFCIRKGKRKGRRTGQI